MSDLNQYRASSSEKSRTEDLLSLLPSGRQSVLDVGARDGHFSKLLTQYFPEVTALDLEMPTFEIPGVTPVAGDATNLEFADNSFDCVFCAEVLEHIPDVEQACREIARVARHEIIIGVPFQQDTRIGRTKCPACLKINPPWGHVNTFDQQKLRSLFQGIPVSAETFVGTNHAATNPLSIVLMDWAGHPWGTYEQDEPCIYCGEDLTAPASRGLMEKVCSGLAVRLDRIQARWTPPHANWVHVVFSKS